MVEGSNLTPGYPSTSFAGFPPHEYRSQGGSELPDVDPLVRREIQLVARLDVERLVPGVDIPNDAVHPILARAVLVGDDLLALGVLALLLLPGLGPGDEEALIAGQSVDHRRLPVLGDVFLVRRIGRLDARQVADVLAQSQLAVQMQIGPRIE